MKTIPRAAWNKWSPQLQKIMTRHGYGPEPQESTDHPPSTYDKPFSCLVGHDQIGPKRKTNVVVLPVEIENMSIEVSAAPPQPAVGTDWDAAETIPISSGVKACVTISPFRPLDQPLPLPWQLDNWRDLSNEEMNYIARTWRLFGTSWEAELWYRNPEAGCICNANFPKAVALEYRKPMYNVTPDPTPAGCDHPMHARYSAHAADTQGCYKCSQEWSTLK